ncbi:hypothetical protein M514_05253 [Trichuris suis]|uniref:Reverse transcriptase domain-containing protein n=1 Tax=Trichuris suis TaxID=68888 RepID=A0A085ND27_9BILA|nr:hypothetical protein M513_05253 [Trichuris suis]KFD67373.1 hypothetical protein M514_05253 [Trichuris suis]
MALTTKRVIFLWIDLPVSPLSPVLAEIFMEHLVDKEFDITNAAHVPRFFKRYVDDILAIVETGKGEPFLEYLNSLFPNCVPLPLKRRVGMSYHFSTLWSSEALVG